jgi:hypothetical protein
LKQRPGDVGVARARAPLLGRIGRFAESTAGYELAARHDPDDAHSTFCAAIGRLHAGEDEPYRAHARALLDRGAKSADVGAHEWAAKVYLLAPAPGDAEGLTLATQLIDDHLAAVTDERWRAWSELTKAMAEYRAGDFDACLRWLARFRGNVRHLIYGDPRNPEGVGLTLAAMAHHQLGRADEARRCLAESKRLMDQCPTPGEADLGVGPENRQVWEIFLREATALLESEPKR